MTIGSLRHRVAIQTRTDVADGMGGKTSSWATVATVWAKIEPLSAREQFFAGKTDHRITHRITMRPRTITHAQRLVFGARTFQIHGVRELEERNRWVVVDCEEGVAS